jgi:tripartite-type tricarboxylate transporter receptor subunit TctC
MDWLNSLFGRPLTAAFLAASLVSGSPIVASADPIADFYKGNTVHLLVGTGVGGEYDLNARLIARFIGDHIPGNPTVIVQNMTGASGMTMDGYLYSVAPQDGTYLGTVMNNFPMYQAMNRPGIKFDVTKFQWVGSIAPVLETVVTWHTTGVKSVDDARKKQIVVGAVGKDSIHYILYVMLNQYLHTQFKIIAGYQSGNELDLAMERGEAEGRIIAWSALKTNKPEWLRQMQVNILVQLGPKAPDLPDVPSIMELVKNENEARMMAFVTAADRFGRPVVSAPQVPAERVNALREAFNATMQDPAFLKAAARSNVEVKPVSGEELQKMAAEVLDTPKPLIDVANKLAK